MLFHHIFGEGFNSYLVLWHSMESEILRVASSLFGGREVTTEKEVERIAIRSIFIALKEKVLGLDTKTLIDEIKESFLTEPISLNSLHFSERLELEGFVFCHTHTYKPSREQFEDARHEYHKSIRLLDNYQTMKEVVRNFFRGYQEREGLISEYVKGKYKYAVFFSLIDDLGADLPHHLDFAGKYDGEYVVVTPTEDSIDPFLRFFKRYSEDVKKSGLKVWVVNTADRTIDPFIGYPKDFLLLKGFKNPRLATMVNSWWRVSVEEID